MKCLLLKLIVNHQRIKNIDKINITLLIKYICNIGL